MILQLQPNILLLQKETLLHALAESNFQTTEVTTQYGQYLVAIGKTEIDIRLLGHLDGIADIHVVNDTYKLVSKQWKVNPTQIDLGDGVFIGLGKKYFPFVHSCLLCINLKILYRNLDEKAGLVDIRSQVNFSPNVFRLNDMIVPKFCQGACPKNQETDIREIGKDFIADRIFRARFA